MSLAVRVDRQPVLHLRLDGRSTEIPLAALGLSLAATDRRIKDAVARHLDRRVESLDSLVVVRHEHIATEALRQNHEDGWQGCLDSLAGYVES